MFMRDTIYSFMFLYTSGFKTGVLLIYTFPCTSIFRKKLNNCHSIFIKYFMYSPIKLSVPGAFCFNRWPITSQFL